MFLFLLMWSFRKHLVQKHNPEQNGQIQFGLPTKSEGVVKYDIFRQEKQNDFKQIHSLSFEVIKL